MASTNDVLDHHIKCFGEGDLTGILSDYAPAAVLFTPDGPLKGLDAIRPFFQAMLAEFGKPGTAFSIKHRSVEGDCAYVLWTAETADTPLSASNASADDGCASSDSTSSRSSSSPAHACSSNAAR